MSATITFFPVGNGDMTLIKLNDADHTTILIDINIRAAADDPQDDTCDVAAELRKRLNKDAQGRPYVDAFLLSHPDKDHCAGLSNHFHLGPPEDYNDEPPEGEKLKILIRELWSSPMVFRRASKKNTLCDDAKAFNKEARRRVTLYRKKKGAGVQDGDRIKLIGEDEEGKTDDVSAILEKRGTRFSAVNGRANGHMVATVLGPFPKQELDEDEDALEKNHSSVILRFSLAANANVPNACLFLTGGDAAVLIWEALWGEYKHNREPLQYDLLLSPHHCSWHTLSYDSWGKSKSPKVNEDARSALAQANPGAFIVFSSKPIKDDDSDPPCIGAKNEYVAIVDSVKGDHFCTGEYPTEKASEPLEFTITSSGPQAPGKKKPALAAVGIGATKQPLPHG